MEEYQQAESVSIGDDADDVADDDEDEDDVILVEVDDVSFKWFLLLDGVVE